MIQSRVCMILWVITTLQYGDAFQVTSIVNPPNRERLLITPSIERVALQQRSSSSVIWGKWQLGLSTASNDDEPDQEEDTQQSSSTGSSNKKRRSKKKKLNFDDDGDDTGISKEDIVKAVGETFRSQQQQQQSKDSGNSILDRINPFKAGQNLRKTIDETLTQISSPVDATQQSKYYLDDRFLEPSGTTRGGGGVSSRLASSSTSTA